MIMEINASKANEIMKEFCRKEDEKKSECALYVLGLIEKEIKNKAEKGFNVLLYDYHSELYNDSIREKVCNTLLSNGYKVEKSIHFMTITW